MNFKKNEVSTLQKWKLTEIGDKFFLSFDKRMKKKKKKVVFYFTGRTGSNK